MDAAEAKNKKRGIPNGELVLHWGNGKKLRGVKREGTATSSGAATGAAVLRKAIRADRRIARTEKKGWRTRGQQSQGDFRSPSATNLHKTTKRDYVTTRSSSVPSAPDSIKKGKTKNGVSVKSPPAVKLERPLPERSDKTSICTIKKEMVVVDNGHEGCCPTGSYLENAQFLEALIPKLMVALSHKEKEEDFMAIKGSKLPQRPKKRTKFAQKAVHCISPGSWLCELSLDRYEVREKKSLKKKLLGLKALALGDGADSDKS